MIASTQGPYPLIANWILAVEEAWQSNEAFFWLFSVLRCEPGLRPEGEIWIPFAVFWLDDLWLQPFASSMMNPEEQQQAYQKIIAKCWADEDFKEQFLADPASVLRDEGIEVPSGINVRAVENTPEKMTIVVPRQPENMEADEVDRVAGGGALCFCSWSI